MNPNAFSASLFRWDPRSAPAAGAAAPPPYSVRARGLQELFEAYGAFRSYSAAKLAELGFTVNTLLNMRDEELDEMMDTLCHIFRWDLLVAERHTIKAAVGAERRRLFSRPQQDEGPVVLQPAREAAGSSGGKGGGGMWEMVAEDGKRLRTRKIHNRRPRMASVADGGGGGNDDDEENGGSRGSERQREHPFVVTVPGEVARGKKNGLDYLFHLYEQCHQFLIQFQKIAKERGEKYPTKVTNQVFRYAKKVGACYINKPKMRHYVHCYALHCLDEAASDALRGAYKERNESVGSWRQACYEPLVAIAARLGWDIDAIFAQHPRLSIWYVPTKLRQLCHSERINATSGSATGGGGADQLLLSENE